MTENRNVIHIKGAKEHNLKNINLDIPLNHLIAVTGVSGSGKSSLARDILYAEGQRRYVETFSPYSRQFLERLDRPRVDTIEGIPPAITIESGTVIKNSRSTVGTLTELNSLFKLLFSHAATPFCPRCNIPLTPTTAEDVVKEIKRIIKTNYFLIAFPTPTPKKAKDQDKWRGTLMKKGFSRFWDEGRIRRIETDTPPHRSHVFVVIDRIARKKASHERLIDSTEQAFNFGEGKLALIQESGQIHTFTRGKECPSCGLFPPESLPNLFSFNSPAGACPSCKGFGHIIDIDLDLVVPDKNLTLSQGAIKPWRTKKTRFRRFLEFCNRQGIPVDIPYKNLDPEHKKIIMEGKGKFLGVKGFFSKLTRKTYKLHVRVFLSRYRTYLPCPDCQGTRFQPRALLFRLHGKTIAQFYQRPIADLHEEFLQTWENEEKQTALSSILQQIRHRLNFLKGVGLDYLTLERQSRTLSGGEVQRLHLTKALGSKLVNVLYILDEPSIGLHPRDHTRLLGLLKSLVNMGNTAIVVEHEPEIIKKCDLALDLGPEGGDRGGNLIFFGLPTKLPFNKKSITGRYLEYPGDKSFLPEKSPAQHARDFLEVTGVCENNLKNIHVRIPLGFFVCITGVSGSGKSTLMEEIIFKGTRREKSLGNEKPGKYRKIIGLDHIDDVILLDQRPVGKTPRSNLLTYIQIFTPIRNFFASTPEAREMGLRARHFSFNVSGGRCPVCQGSGFKKIEMQFMADIHETCPACKGKRFTGRVLRPRYKGLTITDILELSVEKALDVFREKPGIQRPLATIAELGLGYLKLGQPLDTLSGGESQRLKLVRFLQKGSDRKLFLLDEPTIGLHPSEIENLTRVLREFVYSGNTVLVVEHNLQLISQADWVIDLGPEGGNGGGRIVACGPPQKIAQTPGSHTGEFLRSTIFSGVEKQVTIPEPEISPHKISDLASHSVVIRGAHLHNLSIDFLAIPRNRLVVITGISGSGKSTLAFDLLFAEGQRRYLECLSAYVRQYFKIMEKAEVDEISGLPPTVAIEQRMGRLDVRSTVATVSEIYHFIRLLYSKLGQQYCPQCRQPISPLKKETIVEEIEKFGKTRVTILAPVVRARKGIYRSLLKKLAGKGFTEARIDGMMMPLSPTPELNRFEEHDIEIVVSRFYPHQMSTTEINDTVLEAMNLGKDSVVVLTGKEEKLFSADLYCYQCRKGYLPLDPRLFSFNSSYGACGFCKGKGIMLNEKRGYGKNSEVRPCPKCGGRRLNPQALAVKVAGNTIDALMENTISQLRDFLPSWRLHLRHPDIYEPILEEIEERLQFLEKVGLGYLELNRAGNTLSGGETQRLRLAAQLGTNLKGICYILDEPTIGLHPSDHHKLLSALQHLRNEGNTVIVVEHDPETIKAADYIVDLGPGAGRDGGKVVVTGTREDLVKSANSITGKFLAKRTLSERKRHQRDIAPGGWLTVKNATFHNLKNISVSIPLENFVCVTGVSGSGKSSLVMDTIYQGLTTRKSYPFASFHGRKKIARILKVDHSPIGKTPRSIPATYVGFFDDIRKLFAATPVARTRGFSARHFSFNVKGGRCATCQGQGRVKVVMSFLPEVYNTCEECHGNRFKPDILGVQYKGKNISEVLKMTISEALDFFKPVRKIAHPLKLLLDLGLGYLTLGQPSPTLSGGESQRIKLVTELSKRQNGHTLYILDEPTTGLHSQDIGYLLQVLQQLVDAENTVLVIEHNLEFLSASDYIIDLGPGGGPHGGRVIASGPMEEFIKCAGVSKTAQFLREILNSEF